MILLSSDNVPQLQAAMARYVSEAGMSCHASVMKQAGLLKRDLVEQMPPSNKSSTERAIASDASGVFARFSRFTFPEHQRGGGKGIIWFTVSKKFGLTGATDERFDAVDSGKSMDEILRANRWVNLPRYSQLGSRGNQSVRLINRFMVRKSAFASWLRLQREKVGKLKASFAVDWVAYGPRGKTPPQWVMRHAASGSAKGASRVERSEDRTTFTIMSWASGVNSPQARAAVAQAIQNRVAKIIVDLKRAAQRKKILEDEA